MSLPPARLFDVDGISRNDFIYEHTTFYLSVVQFGIEQKDSGS